MYQNVNANIFVCANTTREKNCYSHLFLFDTITASKKQKPYNIGKFDIVLNLSALFDEKFSDVNHNVKIGETYEGVIKIKHGDSHLGVTLANFDIDFSEENIEYACGKAYFSKTQILTINSLSLPPGCGDYTIEFCMREKTDNTKKWQLQTLKKLLVC